MEGGYFGLCEEYLSETSRNKKERPPEASSSIGMRHMMRVGSDSHILRRGSQGSGQSCDVWIEDAYIHDRCRSVETIFEENSPPTCRVSTPELTHDRRRVSVEDVIHQLRLVRKAMEEGIEEMQCQMYQIQFCNNKLKQKSVGPKSLMDTHLPMSSPSLSQDKPHSGRIASAREMLYESSRSGTDQSPDYCAIAQKPYSPEGCHVSISPIRTPNFLESSDTILSRHAASVNNELVGSQQCEAAGLPAPEVSAFQVTHSHFSTSDESLQDVCQLVEDTLAVDMSREPSMTRVHVNPCKGLKTDVVLNLNGQAEMPRPKRKHAARAPRESTVDKFMGLFRKKKHSVKDIRRTIMSESPQLIHSSKSKSHLRWSLKSPLPRMNRTSTSSSGGCKFTEKYPTSCQQRDLLQCFSCESKGPKVELESDTVASSSLGAIRHFILSADAVASGTMCFDVTCLRLTGWCFVGVVSKTAAMNSQGAVSECGMAYGWSNEGKCIRKSMPHFMPEKEPFKTGTNFQVIVSAEMGTLNFRFPRDRKSGAASRKQEYVEHEIALPKKVEWSLAIEWIGRGRFELNSVHAWQ